MKKGLKRTLKKQHVQKSSHYLWAKGEWIKGPRIRREASCCHPGLRLRPHQRGFSYHRNLQAAGVEKLSGRQRPEVVWRSSLSLQGVWVGKASRKWALWEEHSLKVQLELGCVAGLVQ